MAFNWHPRGARGLLSAGRLRPETPIEDIALRLSSRDALKALNIYCLEWSDERRGASRDELSGRATQRDRHEYRFANAVRTGSTATATQFAAARIIADPGRPTGLRTVRLYGAELRVDGRSRGSLIASNSTSERKGRALTALSEAVARPIAGLIASVTFGNIYGVHDVQSELAIGSRPWREACCSYTRAINFSARQSVWAVPCTGRSSCAGFLGPAKGECLC